MPGRPHGRLFGRCVGLMDLDGDGRTEAVIASADALVGSGVRRGFDTVLRATPFGLTTQGAYRLDSSDFGVPAINFGCDLTG